MTDLLEIIEDLKAVDRPRRLYALVVSPKVYQMVQDLDPGPVVRRTIAHPDTLWGFQVVSFPDVPDYYVTGFYDQGAYAQYLRLREKLGHSVALQRMSPLDINFESKNYPPATDES